MRTILHSVLLIVSSLFLLNTQTIHAQMGTMMGVGPGFGSMMGYGNYSIFGLITWVLLLVFLASGTYYFLKESRKK